MSDDRDPIREMAAAYALGALEPDEATRFRHLLATDPRLRREVQEYREVMALLAGSVAPVDPPAGGKARILGRVRQSVDADAASGEARSVAGGTGAAPRPGGVAPDTFPSPGGASIDYDGLEWEPSGVPGVDIFWISHDPGTGESVLLMRGDPGVTYPDHHHPGGEHGFVLRGAFSDALGLHEAGSYLRYAPGSVHRDIEVRGEETCIFLVMTGPVPAGA